MSGTYFSTCTARGGGLRKISDLGSHFSCRLISLMARSAPFYQTCWLVRAGGNVLGCTISWRHRFCQTQTHTHTLPSLPLVGTHRPLLALVTPLMSSNNTPLPPPPATPFFSFSSIPPPLFPPSSPHFQPPLLHLLTSSPSPLLLSSPALLFHLHHPLHSSFPSPLFLFLTAHQPPSPPCHLVFTFLSFAGLTSVPITRPLSPSPRPPSITGGGTQKTLAWTARTDTVKSRRCRV